MSQHSILENRDMKFPTSMPPPPFSTGQFGRYEQDGRQNLSRDQRKDVSSANFRKQPEFPPLPKLQDVPVQNKELFTDNQQTQKSNEPPISTSNQQDLKAQTSSSDNSKIDLGRDSNRQFISTDEQDNKGDHKANLQQSMSPQQNQSIINVKPNITDKSSDKRDDKEKYSQTIKMKDETASASRKRSSSRSKRDKRRSRSKNIRRHSKHKRRSHHKHKGKDSHKHKHRSHRHKSRQDYDRYSYSIRRHSSSRSRSESSSSSSSKSSSPRDRRKMQQKDYKKPKTGIVNVHPYFQRKKDGEDPNAPKLFWDGFQWVTRSQPVFDVAQNAAEQATKAVTGEDQKQNEERIAASKTVIIENIALDLGLTAKDLQKFLLDKLEEIGEKDVVIVDIDMSNGPTSVAVELLEKPMVDKVKKLDGIHCLGEKLKVRKVNEETVQTSATAAAITLAALKSLTSGNQDSELNLKGSTLKTVNVSSVIKVSNVIDRDEEMTPEIYEDLYEDMENEFQKIPHLKRVKVVRNGEERLGAEVGSVFVEFRDKKSAELGLKMMKGRIYDGREIKVCFVDEQLYYNELCIP